MIYPDQKIKRVVASAKSWKMMRRGKWVEQGGRCAECGKPIKLHGDIWTAGHLRHRKSKGAGGDDTPENCDKMLCYECHFGPKHHGPRWTGLIGE